MREILFKAKRLDNGEWVEGYYIGPVGVLDVHEICDIHDIAGTQVEVDPSTVCQYTGQVDYESEEPIFCDDLLKSQNGADRDNGRRPQKPPCPDQERNFHDPEI